MKNFKNIILFGFIISMICCTAQSQALPLITATSSIPNNAHVKDLNNELNSLQRRRQTGNYGDQKFYRDALVVKYIVKNSAGTILQDTKNNNFPKIYMYSTKIRSTDNTALLTYSGTNCRVGWGAVELKKLNATQISWEYLPNDIILDSSRCPSGTDINIYLPETKDLIFTKQ